MQEASMLLFCAYQHAIKWISQICKPKTQKHCSNISTLFKMVGIEINSQLIENLKYNIKCKGGWPHLCPTHGKVIHHLFCEYPENRVMLQSYVIKHLDLIITKLRAYNIRKLLPAGEWKAHRIESNDEAANFNEADDVYNALFQQSKPCMKLKIVIKTTMNRWRALVCHILKIEFPIIMIAMTMKMLWIPAMNLSRNVLPNGTLLQVLGWNDYSRAPRLTSQSGMPLWKRWHRLGGRCKGPFHAVRPTLEIIYIKVVYDVIHIWKSLIIVGKDEVIFTQNLIYSKTWKGPNGETVRDIKM